ncbi:MAG: GntR family transcriptional regulator [Spirochaetales bacterium]|nr:GntR family transcriptional regulator [Spirochaetales bacterium]
MQYENRPIYIQIADYLYEMILSGKWTDGERVPSIREMAVQMEVNPNTMTRTYGLLQEQGVIFNKRGIGYFAADKARDMTLRLKREEFIHSELPDFFKKMEFLGMTPEELDELFNRYKESNHEDK